jgi:hypothetical protein
VRDEWFSELSVAPIGAGDRNRFDAQLDEHHWLGHRMVGGSMRYAALDANGEWVALLGFASPALSCGPRDRFIGWWRERVAPTPLRGVEPAILHAAWRSSPERGVR